MAQRLWPGASPIGQTSHLHGRTDRPIEVVGVVPDLGERSFADLAAPSFYQPFAQDYAARMTVLLKVHGEPGPFFGEIRRTVRRVNRDLSIVELRTLDAFIDTRVGGRRLPAALLSVLGLLGLLLTAVGLYGVTAYGVRARVRELGIRLALGARPDHVRRLVVRQGLAVVGFGLALGAAGVVVVRQIVATTLFGAGPVPLPVVAGVAGVLLAAGLAALYLPARWASKVDPARTLRSD